MNRIEALPNAALTRQASQTPKFQHKAPIQALRKKITGAFVLLFKQFFCTILHFCSELNKKQDMPHQDAMPDMSQ